MPEDPKNQLEYRADLEFVNNLKTAADVLLRLRMSVYISDEHRRRNILSESSDSYESDDSDEPNQNDRNDTSIQIDTMPLPPQSPPHSNNYTNDHSNVQTTTPLPPKSPRHTTPEEVQEHIVHNYAYAYDDASLALAQSLGISIEDARMILSDNN